MRTGFILLLAVLLGSAIVFQGAAAEADAAALPVEALLSDYDQFWRTLKASFPFYPQLGEDSRVERARESNRRLIGARIHDIQGLLAVLQSAIRQLERSPHFEMILPANFEMYKAIAVAYGLPEKPQFLDARTQAVYALLAAKGQAGLSPPESPPAEARYYPDIQTVYFRFPSFAVQSAEEASDGGVASFLNRHPEAGHVIFNITGNRGGNTDYWQRAIVSAFSQPFEWVTHSYLRLTPETEGFYAGKPLQPIEETDKKQLPEFVETYRLTHHVSETVHFPLAGGTGQRVNGAIKRWVLIDGQVFSAADSFAKFCRDTGFAELVGTTTGGGGALTRAPVVCRLDNSGLLYRFMAETYANDRGQPSVMEGTSPDYPSLPKHTPLETCLRLIRGMEGK